MIVVVALMAWGFFLIGGSLFWEAMGKDDPPE